jgi:hypothetical protein
MSIYSIVLFLHIIGAIGYFLGIGIWLFILLGLRWAQRIEHVRALIHLNDLSAPFSGASAVLLLITGLYLAITAWSLLTSWILVALISLLVMVPITAVLIAPRRSAIVKEMAREAPGGELSPALERHIDDSILAMVCTTGAALLLGLVFLMTTKPDLVGAILVMIVALVLGVGSGIAVSRLQRPQRQERSAQRQSHKVSEGMK